MASTSAAGDSARQPIWKALSDKALAQLIMDQIPRFKERPFLEDASALTGSALIDHIASTLDGDFCWSLCFSPEFIRALAFEGFLPISCELGGGTGLFVLLPKLHEQRCILAFADLHVPRKVRKRAKQYTLTVDDAFDAVLDGCLDQHEDSWINPPLLKSFRYLGPTASCAERQDQHQSRRNADLHHSLVDEIAATTTAGPSSPAFTTRSDADANQNLDAGTACPAEQNLPPPAVVAASSTLPTPSASLQPPPTAEALAPPKARMCCFALWLDDALVAGEFGAVVGSSYTSYSGFYKVDGAGAVQMALTAKVLEAAGFPYWDLGQEHAYKLGLGARMVERQTFLPRFREARSRPNRLSELSAQQPGRRFRAEDLLHHGTGPGPGTTCCR